MTDLPQSIRAKLGQLRCCHGLSHRTHTRRAIEWRFTVTSANSLSTLDAHLQVLRIVRGAVGGRMVDTLWSLVSNGASVVMFPLR
jgi:hypothetical protein